MSERMAGIVPEHAAAPGMRNNGIARDFAAELLAKHEAGEWVDPVRVQAAKSMLRAEAPEPQREPECQT